MAKIILDIASGEYKCLGSTFLAEVGPLSDESLFKDMYDAFKKNYPKADHYPYAYRLPNHSKSSDDGEPGSSAGRPLLSLLEEKDLMGYVIVARYFGGTKLGIPRLRRSILEAAEAALDSVKKGQEKTMLAYDVEVDYSLYQTLVNLSSRKGFSLQNTDFGIKVKTTLLSGDKLGEVFRKADLDPTFLKEPRIITVIMEE